MSDPRPLSKRVRHEFCEPVEGHAKLWIRWGKAMDLEAGIRALESAVSDAAKERDRLNALLDSAHPVRCPTCGNTAPVLEGEACARCLRQERDRLLEALAQMERETIGLHRFTCPWCGHQSAWVKSAKERDAQEMVHAAKCEKGPLQKLAKAEAERDAAITERAQVVAELTDIKASYRATVDGPCAPDEQHCSCVPALRAEVERLKATLSTTAASASTSVSALRGEVATLRAQLAAVEQDAVKQRAAAARAEGTVCAGINALLGEPPRDMAAVRGKLEATMKWFPPDHIVVTRLSEILSLLDSAAPPQHLPAQMGELYQRLGALRGRVADGELSRDQITEALNACQRLVPVQHDDQQGGKPEAGQ